MGNPVDKLPTTEIRLRELAANGSNYVALKAPDSIAANVTLTLPDTDGASGEVLRTDGSGALTFVMGAEGLVAADNSWTGINAFNNTTEATTGGAAAVMVDGGIFVAKKIIGASSIRTAAPTAGTAADWKIGSKVTSGTSALDTTSYVEVDIDGVLVKLGVVTNS